MDSTSPVEWVTMIPNRLDVEHHSIQTFEMKNRELKSKNYAARLAYILLNPIHCTPVFIIELIVFHHRSQ